MKSVTVAVLTTLCCHLLVHGGHCYKMEDFGKSVFFCRDFVQSMGLVCRL